MRARRMKTEQQHREEIVRFGKLLHRQGWWRRPMATCRCAWRTATFFARHADEQRTAGATGPVIVDQRGNKVSGARDVSSEVNMHVVIYRSRRDVGAVVHAHPPTATGYAAAGLALDRALCSEIIVTLGSVLWPAMSRPVRPSWRKRWRLW